jgi:DNA-binding transcriptional ArsR family regulator
MAQNRLGVAPDSTENESFTPEDVMSHNYRPEREPGALFVQAFTPKSRALILHVLLSQPAEALTISEIAAYPVELAKSSIHGHIDALVDLGLVVEAGKKGNAQTYRLENRHPVIQLLAMIDNVFQLGRTPQYLGEQFVFEGDSDDLHQALAEENIEVPSDE